MNRGKPCKECADFGTMSCEGMTSRMMWIEDYGYDCFVTEEDKWLCEMMCGGVESDE